MSSVKDLLRGDVIDGSGTANYIPKFIDTNTIGNSAIYESSGNIVVGGTTPQSVASGRGNITINGSSESILNFSSANSRTGYLYHTGTDMILSNNQSGVLRFQTSEIERMSIDSSGRVGIGVTPAAWNSTSKVLQIGSLSSLSQQHNGSVNLLSNAYESGQSSFSNLVYGYAGRYNIDPNTGVHSWYNSALTNSGAPTTWLERMRITSTGRVIISSSQDPSTVIVTNNRNVNGDAVMYNILGVNTHNTSSFFYVAQNGTVGNALFIYGNGNVVNVNNSYGALSDVKLKENIVDATPKLDDLLKVKVRNYNLIGDDNKQLGVVAQELEEVFPSMIDESPDFENQEVTDEEGNVTTERIDLGTTTKSVKYSVFVPMLIKAMQEQQEIIEGLKARIETLENK